MVTVDDIPVAHTPPGGYGGAMPAPIVEVRRRRDGDELMWDYAGAFTARMRRS